MFIVRSADLSCPLVPGDLILVGRDHQCDIQLDDPSASRTHCRLLSKDGRVFVTDADSRWGTFVNGSRVEECELKPGDEITVGETTLHVEVLSRPADETIAPRSELHRPPNVRSLLKDAIEAPAAPPVAVDDGPAPPVPKADAHPTPTPVSPRHPPIRKEDFVGKSFGNFHVNDFLRRTQSGMLFRASGPQGDVALKLLQPKSLASEIDRQRFLRATDVARNLDHPNLVNFYEGGFLGDVAYTACEFVPGESAAELIRRIGIAGMLDWRTTLRIGLDIANALEALEGAGVIHRNITPQHVLVHEETGVAKLSDVLLAKAMDDSRGDLTAAGETVGEIPFLSPEQVGSGDSVDCRSDIYQLGAMMFALLTGHPPFEDRNMAILIQRILEDKPSAPTQAHLAIPALLEGAVLTMLEKRPQDRHQSASELKHGLLRVQRFSGS